MSADYNIYVFPYEKGGDSRALLREAAARETGLSPGAFAVETGPWGKPFFPNRPALHFSVTHSGGWWLCAFGSAPVGLDLQDHRPAPREKLARRYFHPDEVSFLEARGFEGFFDIWAAKESYVKYTGQGLYTPLDSFSVVQGDGFAVCGAQLRPLDFCPAHSLCLCTEDPGRIALS